RNVLAAAKLNESRRLGDRRILDAALGGGAAVARRYEHLLHARALRELPGERMLAAARADHEDFHLVAEVAHAGEHHGDAALVGRGDHLVVTHAAARLYHRRGARFGERFEAVTERKEGVRGDGAACERQAG